MPRIPIKVGEFSFDSKKEAKDFYSSILNSTGIGNPIDEIYFEPVMSLLLNHPRAKEKIGIGVEAIIVDQGFHSGNRCFHVIRKDDSKEDFSIWKCIDGDHTEFHKFCIASRRAVDHDVIKFKKSYFEKYADENGMVECKISGKLISYEESHVDHIFPMTFSFIASSFIQENNMKLELIEYNSVGKYGNEFSDNNLSELFREYHKGCANFRVVAEKENLRIAYQGRIKK